MKQLITNIRFWLWAAMHSKQFDSFQIGFTRLLKIKAYYSAYGYERFIIHICFYVPSFFYNVNYTTADNFIEANKDCYIDDLFGFDDIPF